MTLRSLCEKSLTYTHGCLHVLFMERIECRYRCCEESLLSLCKTNESRILKVIVSVYTKRCRINAYSRALWLPRFLFWTMSYLFSICWVSFVALTVCSSVGSFSVLTHKAVDSTCAHSAKVASLFTVPDAAMPEAVNRRLYFRSAGGRQRYRHFETEIIEVLSNNLADGQSTLAVALNIQKGGDNESVSEYRSTLTSKTFEQFWYEIQALDVGTLPASERMQLNSSRFRGRMLDAPTHTYEFYDGSQDAFNCFKVHNAAFSSDSRYQSLHDSVVTLLRSTFGETPF